jgi:hypothetical protein
MSERKSVNKYYPPNFDPRKVPPVERKNDYKDPNKGVTFTVRLMSPFSMQCISCGEFIYKGRKFNARKEVVLGQDYLGIKLHRFNIRCPVCASEIVFRTDPKTDDYVCEKGAKRNSEPWKDRVREREARLERLRRTEELGGADDPLKELERKAYSAKREIEISETLENIRAARARIEKIDPEMVLEGVRSSGALERLKTPAVSIGPDQITTIAAEVTEDPLPSDDEELVRKTFSKSKNLTSIDGVPSLSKDLQSGDDGGRTLGKANVGIGGRKAGEMIASKRILFGIVAKKKTV